MASSINKLNSSLKFPDAGKGLGEIDKASRKIDLSHIASGVDAISSKLGVFRLTAIGVFANVATAAISAGERFAKSFTVGPLIQGFQEYATNLNAIQTILANTQASGANLQDVNAALLDLNKYSDKTIYNFSQMAKNIGTFTAAGVDLKTSTASIKGIANLAALSGSNADQASTAMYQLSQAIAAGQVHLMDWNSVVNAGMGGTVFQRALAQTAVSMGKLKDNSLKLVGPMKNVSIDGESFRQSLQTGPGKASWLTSDVLTKTLTQFTGDLTDAELAAQGFNEAQIKSIQATARTAQHAATEVKTIKQVFDVARETAGSGWAQTFQIIFGTFDEAKKTFTDLSNTINGFINKNAQARNKVLADWKVLGGRTILIDAIKNAFHSLLLVIGPIKRAFRDIFPKRTGKELYVLTVQFARFIDRLTPGYTTLVNLRKTFRGLFAILDIGKQIVTGIFTVFSQLFKATGAGDGGFLKLTGRIGDFFVALDKALKRGDALQQFFVKMGAVLAIPLRLLARVSHAISNLFGGFSPGGISAQASGIADSLSPIQRVLEGISFAWDKFKQAIGGVADFLVPQIDKVGGAFANLGPSIVDAIKGMNVEAILQVIRTGLLAGMFLVIKNFLTGSGGLFKASAKINIFNIVFRNVGKSMDALTGSLQAMQNNIKARTMKEIAIAIALLAVSVLALSLADPKRVNASLATMTILFVELLGALKVLSQITTTMGAAKLNLLAASLIGIAIAIDLLTVAVFTLSKLSWDELQRGLTGITVLLTEVVLLSHTMDPRGMIRAGAGITAIGVGLNILALAVLQLGSMNLQELGKGLGATAAALGIIVLAMKVMPPSSVLSGAGLIEVSIALNAIALAMKQFSAMNLKEIGRGVLAIAGALVAIAFGMNLMPLSLPITAAGLILVSFALGKIVDAIGRMGVMNNKVLAKGLIALAGALTILAAALIFMEGSVGGAVALGVAAAGISLLVPALVALGKQSWMEIGKGLTALAAAFALLGAAGLLLTPLAPSLLALGAALTLIGAGFALAGAGVALFGFGLAEIAIAGPAAIAILIKAILDFTASLGEMGKNLALGLLEIVQEFAKTAPMFVNALVKIINTLLDVIIKSTPKLAQAVEVVLTALLKVIRDKAPDIIATGVKLLLDLLKGIRDHIREVPTVAVEVVANLIKGIGSQIKNLIKAGISIIGALITGIVRGLLTLIDVGARAIVRFLNGIADAIDKYEPQILKAGVRIGVAIVTGMIKGLNQEATGLYNHITHMAKTMLKKLKHPWEIFSPSYQADLVGQNIVQGLTNGIKNNADKPVKAAGDMSENVKKAVVTDFNPTIMEKIGKDAVTAFAAGLRGPNRDVNSAFTDLNSKFVDQIKTARATIAEEQDKLKEFLKAKNPDQKAIQKARDAIQKNQAVLSQAEAGHRELTKTLSVERGILNLLIDDYESISKRLDKANQALADAKQKRDDAFRSFRDQYATLPTIGGATDAMGRPFADQVTAYKDALKAQIKAVSDYHTTLDKLRRLGLDDKTYQQLLADGTADQQFATQLLQGGKTAIDGVNKLDTQLNKSATSLAKTASQSLYQAGVDAAQGFVYGLTQRKGALTEEIKGLVLTIVKEVKKALEIKSPSRVFAEIGALSMDGLAKGMLDSSQVVADAAYQVSNDAARAMKDSLSRMSRIISDEIDPNPTITPVLDLSEIQNGSKNLQGILGAPVASVSLSGASTISAAQTASTQEADTSEQQGSVIRFEQNNYSPEALSAIQIYRQTRTQISTLRSILNPV
jgi:tape measure domain-containing protein